MNDKGEEEEEEEEEVEEKESSVSAASSALYNKRFIGGKSCLFFSFCAVGI